ncbi:hypothetical protein K7X08_012086 [Anisodus acutangulus]|uniref:Uncharacterized protein n=1 Tax=Anisodus acutangulus TaxID=402998 RepID=A0A9Q1R014_9SOLA|nr:hypothetical protein K7X08_012086 [Anisodus acutangulus]
MPIESKLDGVALCERLQCLSIRNVGDLNDMGLIAIGRGCSRLAKFEIQGCKKITTMRGMRTLASLLKKTLVDAKNLGASSSLKALEPIQERIQKLHIDLDDHGIGCNPPLWIGVGELSTPLTAVGLEDCPNLEEIKMRVEGDCRLWSKPLDREFGLSTLLHYPMLSKMHLDCGVTIGYAHTAPSGQMYLSLWERFYLFGIGNLSLTKLDYWPPQDRDVNQRSLSLPAAGLLQECIMLRKLFIHGTAHEHFMMFLLRIPNLRDVQLRGLLYSTRE